MARTWIYRWQGCGCVTRWSDDAPGEDREYFCPTACPSCQHVRERMDAKARRLWWKKARSSPQPEARRVR